MKRLSSILAAAVLVGALHMALMAPAPDHHGMFIDCPMGFICPAGAQEFRDGAVIPSEIALPLIVIVFGLGVASPPALKYHPPDFVSIGTGSRRLLSVLKKE